MYIKKYLELIISVVFEIRDRKERAVEEKNSIFVGLNIEKIKSISEIMLVILSQDRFPIIIE